jgi:shikimate dehydrogenase
MSIQTLISNELPALADMAQYAAILGESPSKGARSPLLWNAAFDAFGIDCKMLPMDVSVENLSAVMNELENDARFIGGAIAVPHKETIATWLLEKGEQRLSSEAKAIGAVNCLYRNEKGELCATNTDGEGALASLKAQYPELTGAKVLLIGPGGAGKAVAAFVSSAIGEQGQLTLSARQFEKAEAYANTISANAIGWPPEEVAMENLDVVINCTTIGSDKPLDDFNLIAFTPLVELNDDNEAASQKLLASLPEDAIVFDIIYDPSPTKLMALAEARGLKTLDGGMMNLEQAVIAFQYAAGIEDMVTIRTIMDQARQAA